VSARQNAASGLIAALVIAAAAFDAHAGEAQCDPARPFEAGRSEHALDSGGLTRRFALYVPRSYSGAAAMPLVLDLHASGITPEVELQITGMEEAAEAEGFIVAAPEAVTPFPRGGHTWNIPRNPGGVDDVTFVAELLRHVSGRLCIDPARVYATGYSGGARLASEPACALSERFAAVSAVGGLRHPRGAEGACRTNGRAVPILAIHSLDDPVNPYDGAAGSPPYWTYGVEEALRLWADRNGCEADPAEERLSSDVTRLAWSSCRDGSAVEFYRLAGSGHTWPGSAFAFPDYLGAAEDEIDATQLSIRFFEKFRLEHDHAEAEGARP
jgi:polyhydroxybutyrate depolymerase